MKFLSLVFSRLQRYYISSKFIFILFITSSVICSMAFIFCYGNLVSYMSLRSSKEIYYRRYEISLPDIVSINKIPTSLLEDEKIADIAYCKYIDKDSTYYLYASINNKDIWYPKQGRVKFTENEYNQAENAIVVPSNENETPKDVFIGEEKYLVIGMHTSFDECIIPLSTFLQKNYSIDKIVLIMKSIPTFASDAKLQENLAAIFPNCVIKSPINFLNATRRDFPIELILISLMYTVALISFVFLMKYMAEKSYFENIIYSIVGASKSLVLLYLIIESVVISSLTAICGVLIHLSLYGVIFSKINIVSNLYYNISDYAIIFFVIILISLLVNVPFLLIYYKNSLISTKNKLD